MVEEILEEILDAKAKVVIHTAIGYSVGTIRHFVQSLISARVKKPTRANVIKLAAVIYGFE